MNCAVGRVVSNLKLDSIVYFAGFACSGAVFSLALDNELETDTSYDLGGIHFIMDDNEYLTYGNVTIGNNSPEIVFSKL